MSDNIPTLPSCFDKPKLDDLKDILEKVAIQWDQGKIKNIRFALACLKQSAMHNEFELGNNLLNCRAEWVRQHNEINRLRAENEKLNHIAYCDKKE